MGVIENRAYYNELLRFSCQRYFVRDLFRRYARGVADYGPMITDRKFAELFPDNGTFGTDELEQRNGGRFAVEDLKACPLSVEYFLFGRPIITGTEAERLTLEQFAQILDTMAANDWRYIKQANRETAEIMAANGWTNETRK